MAVTDYLKAITSEHSTKPNYMAFVELFLDKIQDIENCLSTFETAFNLQLAQGAQQDVLGNILNVSRILQFETTEGSGVLDDASYSLILNGKILKNDMDGSIQTLYDIWNSMYPVNPLLVKDYQDMSADMMVMTSLTPQQLELLVNGLLIPKTAAVNVNYINVSDPIFAYDMEPFVQEGVTYFAGYDVGYWAEVL